MGWQKAKVSQICPKCKCACEETVFEMSKTGCIDGLIMCAITYLIFGNNVKCPKCRTKYPKPDNSPSDGQQPPENKEPNQ